jgi:thymidylate kinase
MSKIITFEGSDYSGKTTTSKRLVELLNGRGLCSKYNTGVVYPGTVGDIVSQQAKRSDDIQRELLYTLAFAADRIQESPKRSDSWIVQDRYWPSVVAYGRFINGESSFHANVDTSSLFIQPAVVVYLTCSHEEKVRRARERSTKTSVDLFVMEDPKRMSQLEGELERVVCSLRGLCRIDTTATPLENVTEQVIRHLERYGVI